MALPRAVWRKRQVVIAPRSRYKRRRGVFTFQPTKTAALPSVFGLPNFPPLNSPLTRAFSASPYGNPLGRCYALFSSHPRSTNKKRSHRPETLRCWHAIPPGGDSLDAFDGWSKAFLPLSPDWVIKPLAGSIIADLNWEASCSWKILFVARIELQRFQ